MDIFNPDRFEHFAADGIRAATAEGQQLLFVPAEALRRTARTAFERLSFTFTRGHLERLIAACTAPDSSDNDRYVCATILRNAEEAARGELPLCQDTGIACIFGFKDNGVIVQGDEKAALSEGTEHVYRTRPLRLSTSCPRTFFDEYDPGNNMPAQVLVQSGSNGLAGPAYRLLFSAKGGGSSNKTTLLQCTKAVLNDSAFRQLLREQIARLGVSACPPYTICVVAGGLSPEHNLYALKLATCGECIVPGDAFWEQEVMRIAEDTGLGAQFGGRRLCIDAKVLRLPRHGASCPVSIGVSCCAHRNLNAFITSGGIFIERTVPNPAELPGFAEAAAFAGHGKEQARVSTEGGIASVLRQLHGMRPGSRVLLSGRILVARDAAHARWQALLDSGRPLPSYCTQYPICYAGPAQTPEGKPTGSFGPTTAGRMDSYAGALMSRGAALVTIAKGNRSAGWAAACKQYGAFYLGMPGGVAALIASRYITSVEVLDYPELGMEAVRLVSVRDMPAFVITDNTGADFYEQCASQRA